ncbi:hypothetical protein TNCV_1493591 [Trichonephila clavipes]|nr:hypothetical protein TNCV_1493591 [Trichonephila clavipes]
MASTRCYVTSARGHGAIVLCLNSAPTPRLEAIVVRRAGTPLTIGEACLQKESLSPRPKSREWDNRKQEMREESPTLGIEELEKRALDEENLRRA